MVLSYAMENGAPFLVLPMISLSALALGSEPAETWRGESPAVMTLGK
jgi:hypothetical protein